jgi:hypothetical protein
MSVYTYGITYEDLVYSIPGVDTSEISALSRVTTQNLIDWAEDASSQINGALAKSGITADANMDATAHRRCKSAVVDYVAMMALGTLGVEGPMYDQVRARWNVSISEFGNRPQQLGTAYTDRSTSNIDTITTTHGTNPWSFVGNGGRGNW